MQERSENIVILPELDSVADGRAKTPKRTRRVEKVALDAIARDDLIALRVKAMVSVGLRERGLDMPTAG